MKKLLILCSLLSLSACWSYDPTIIQGKVMEKGTHLPIPDITVVVYKREVSKAGARHMLGHTKTDSLGQYYFNLDLQAGFKYAHSIKTAENQQYKASAENRLHLEETNLIDLYIVAK